MAGHAAALGGGAEKLRLSAVLALINAQHWWWERQSRWRGDFRR